MMTLAAIDWQAFFFVLFALVACVFAVAVLFTGNIVRMAFYLTLSLGATSGLFFLAGAEFVGAMQLMIYVGGTLVLLIFGVMLTAQARFISLQTSAGEWVLAVVLGSGLLLLLIQAAVSVPDWRTPHPYPGLATGAEALRADAAALRTLAEAANAATGDESGLRASTVNRMQGSQDRISASISAARRDLVPLVPSADGPLGQAADHLESVSESLQELGSNGANREQLRKLGIQAKDASLSLDSASAALAEAAETYRVPLYESKTTTQIGLAFAGPRVDKLQQSDESLRRGMSGYLLPFVIVSVHLLVVLVGAAYMARTKRRASASGS